MADSAPETLSFEAAIKDSSGSGNRTLLLGNGFSIAQAGTQFTYANLLEKSGLADDSPIRNVFSVLDTFDFEKVMKGLEDAAQIELAYGEEDRSKRFIDDAVEVREALIKAIHAVHPGIRFDIPKAERDSCAVFLKNFDSIFTLSYDLLLYWVVLHAASDKFNDGFGLGNQIDGFREYRPDAICNTRYLHGALHLFLGPKRETRKRIVTNDTIIRDITDTIRRSGQLPMFVAEGSSAQKLARINSVPYLRDCYEHLWRMSGSIFILATRRVMRTGTFTTQYLQATSKSFSSLSTDLTKIGREYVSDLHLSASATVTFRFHT